MKKIIGWVVVAIVILGVVGYGISRKADLKVQPPKSPVQQMQKVKIADLPVVHGLPLYVALEKGYFKEAGIDVERVKLDAPNLIIDALLSGQVDMASPSGALGITGVADFKKPGELKIYAVSGGDLQISNDAFLVKSDSPVKAIEELKGKKLGILPGIQWRTISRHILAKHNLVADTDVQIVELAPALQAPALASGQVDALLAIEPMPTIVKAKGIGKEIVTSAAAHDVANPFYGGAGIIRTKFAQENPELTKKILDVFARSIQEIRNNPDGAKQYYKGYTPLEDNLISQAPVLKFKMSNELNNEDIQAIQQFYDIFTKNGVVEGTINARQLIFAL